ncbi:hypothetical protein MKC73_04695 [[Clostridium] innocuum]|nr:hypothetical protein [[Clostridium] innocuum]
MIELLDRFVDTRAKRRHLLYLLTLTALILLLLPYLFLGARLLQLSDYPSVFALLKEPLISSTYVSRIILDTISTATFSFSKAAGILLKELRPFGVITFLLVLLVFPAVEKKRSTTVLLLAILLGACGIFYCTWRGLSSTSLLQAVVYIRLIGGILCAVGVLLLIYLILYFVKQLQGYCLALQMQVEEMEENE